ncbi:MAG TPA: hypothetical protein VNI01_03470, partial [Elusimicrobiota bacterium]|nr:hypothetical protein [Elusimicrobiota bacterium]
RPLLPSPASPEAREGFALDWAIENLEVLLEAARAPLERLAARLERRGQSCRALRAEFELEPYGKDARALDFSAPTREPARWLELLRLELAARPPASGVCALSFSAEPDAARAAQLSLFGPAAQSPDALSAFLAKLAALLGPGRSGSPAPVDSPRPELFAVEPYDPPPPPEVRPPAREMPARLNCALRALRPWVELEVLDGEDARPRSVSGRGIAGTVLVASGPWRMEDGWWGDAPAARDFWDVLLSDEAVYRVFRDRLTGRWYADGIYD